MRLVGFTYEAGAHCLDCAEQRFGVDALDDPGTRDREGNPIHTIYDIDDVEEWCDDCGAPIE